MKKIFLLFLSLIGANTHAAETNFCKDIYGYAEMVMEFRQEGVSLKIMHDTLNSTDSTPTQKRLLTFIINNAYHQPRYSSKENQREAINEFAKDEYFKCLDTIRIK